MLVQPPGHRGSAHRSCVGRRLRPHPPSEWLRSSHRCFQHKLPIDTHELDVVLPVQPGPKSHFPYRLVRRRTSSHRRTTRDSCRHWSELLRGDDAQLGYGTPMMQAATLSSKGMASGSP